MRIGDRVVVIPGDFHMAAQAGATAVVVEDGHVCRDGRSVYSYKDYLILEWDDTKLRNSQMNGAYSCNAFELAEGPR